MAAASNKATGDDNHEALIAYFDRVGPSIPLRPDGTVSVAAIVRSVPLTGRGIIYDNKRNRDLVDARLAAHGIPPLADRRKQTPDDVQRPGAVSADDETRRLRRRNDQLERELLVARSELVETRLRMRRFEAIDEHMAESGRLAR